MDRRDFIKYGTGSALGSLLAACGGGGGSPGQRPSPPAPGPVRAQVALGWTSLALAAIAVSRSSPPLAGRSLAILHTAMYDAWAAYDRVAQGTRHGSALRRPLAEHTLANQVRAFSFAAHAALLDQFPAQKAAIDAHMAMLGYNPADASFDFTLPHGVGHIAARSVIAWAHTDLSNQLGSMTSSGVPYADYSGYAPVNPLVDVNVPTPRQAVAAPDRWQPIAYIDDMGERRTQSFLLPHWGLVRPFALHSGAQFRPPPPVAYGTAAFLAQARQLLAIQATLTDTEKVMAWYWAGGSAREIPPAYWIRFAQLVSTRDGHSESADIKLFFALSNAMFDAGIACWDAKRYYDSARPITAIRYLMAGTTIRGYGLGGAGLRDIPGETWMPYLLPALQLLSFPDHTSGHSTFSMASATVLRLFTGSDSFHHRVTVPPGAIPFDRSTPQQPVTLSWPTFTAAAVEAGKSRLYAGIHFEAADVMGRVLGEQVGKTVFARAQRLWSGGS